MSSRPLAAALLTVLAVGVFSAVGRSPAQAAPGEPAPRLVCRVFPATLTDDAGWDSDDDGHPVGAWVRSMGERGWGIASVDLAVGQKRTGYAQGYQQVCLSPR